MANFTISFNIPNNKSAEILDAVNKGFGGPAGGTPADKREFIRQYIREFIKQTYRNVKSQEQQNIADADVGRRYFEVGGSRRNEIERRPVGTVAEANHGNTGDIDVDSGIGRRRFGMARSQENNVAIVGYAAAVGIIQRLEGLVARAVIAAGVGASGAIDPEHVAGMEIEKRDAPDRDRMSPTLRIA